MPGYRIKKMFANGIGSAVNLDYYINLSRNRYVFCYHRIIPSRQAKMEGVHNSLWLTPEGLYTQIEWMLTIGEIVDLPKILDFSTPNTKPLFALTFDDGWKDNYIYGLPVLLKFKVPAHVFLATDAVEKDALFWTQDITTKVQPLLAARRADQVGAALLKFWPGTSLVFKGRNLIATLEVVERWIEALKLVIEDERQSRIQGFYRQLGLETAPLSGFILNWDEIKAMYKMGVTFGSHTHHHTILEGLPAQQIEAELIVSKSLIEKKLHMEVNSFCYPNGRYDGKEKDVLCRCGYRYGFRLDNDFIREVSNKFYIPRFIVSERAITDVNCFKLSLLGAPLYRSKPHASLRCIDE